MRLSSVEALSRSVPERFRLVLFGNCLNFNDNIEKRLVTSRDEKERYLDVVVAHCLMKGRGSTGISTTSASLSVSENLTNLEKMGF